MALLFMANGPTSGAGLAQLPLVAISPLVFACLNRPRVPPPVRLPRQQNKATDEVAKIGRLFWAQANDVG